MADDWTRNYIKASDQRQQKQQNEQKKAHLAETGAPEAFQQIRERIRYDLDTFRREGKFPQVKLAGDASTVTFKVTASGSPSAELLVELDCVFIKYTLSTLPKGKLEKKTGTLRVDSDLSGVTQIYKNGDAFLDESEVSEFLLVPLLDYVDSQ